MKIGLVVPGGVDRSGTERVIPALLALIERLARTNEVHVFALRQEPRPATYPLLGATVHNIGPRPRQLRTLAAIAREHARAPFAVLHAFWAYPGAIAGLAGRTLGVPVLLHLIGGDVMGLRDIDYGLLRNRRGRAVLRFATSSANQVMVESAAMQQHAHALGIYARRVPLGVDLVRWPPVPPRPAAKTPRLLQVADLNRIKDQSTLLRAANILAQRGFAFELDHIGLDTLNGIVQAEANALGLTDRVRFHGHLSHAHCRDFFVAADLMVVSSRHEAAPVAALEAAVCGTAVVGTHVGFLADWAQRAALTVPIQNPEALADAIATLLLDDARRIELARQAQQRAVAEDADWTASEVLSLYDRLLGAEQPLLHNVSIAAV